MGKILCFLFGHRCIQSHFHYHPSMFAPVITKATYFYRCKRCNYTKVMVDRYDPKHGQFVSSETIIKEK